MEREQRDLLQVIRDEARADSIRKASVARRDSFALATTWLGRDWRLRNAMISPTGRHALVVATHSATPEARNTQAHAETAGQGRENRVLND